MVTIFKNIFLAGLVCFVSVSCNLFDPAETVSEGTAALSLSLQIGSTRQVERVFVNVDAGAQHREGNTEFSAGRLSFSGLPLGHACISVDAVSGKSIKLLDGHTMLNLKAGSNHAVVPLNKVLLSYFLNPTLTNEFLLSKTDRSSFWNANIEKSFAILINNSNTTTTGIEVRAAYSPNDYYFLFEVRNDREFKQGTPNDRTNNGEWFNDACIIYLSTAMTADMPEFSAPNKRSFVRIQCMIGSNPPENGYLEITEFENGVQKTNDLQVLNAIHFARVLQMDSKRIFEICINDNYLKINGDAGERVAMALRYIDKTNLSYQIFDWKNKVGDPRNTLDSWGNIELQPQ